MKNLIGILWPVAILWLASASEQGVLAKWAWWTSLVLVMVPAVLMHLATKQNIKEEKYVIKNARLCGNTEQGKQQKIA